MLRKDDDFHDKKYFLRLIGMANKNLATPLKLLGSWNRLYFFNKHLISSIDENLTKNGELRDAKYFKKVRHLG